MVNCELKPIGSKNPETADKIFRRVITSVVNLVVNIVNLLIESDLGSPMYP